jgi:hypothetical protein
MRSGLTLRAGEGAECGGERPRRGRPSRQSHRANARPQHWYPCLPAGKRRRITGEGAKDLRMHS